MRFPLQATVTNFACRGGRAIDLAGSDQVVWAVLGQVVQATRVVGETTLLDLPADQVVAVEMTVAAAVVEAEMVPNLQLSQILTVSQILVKEMKICTPERHDGQEPTKKQMR